MPGVMIEAVAYSLFFDREMKDDRNSLGDEIKAFAFSNR